MLNISQLCHLQTTENQCERGNPLEEATGKAPVQAEVFRIPVRPCRDQTRRWGSACFRCRTHTFFYDSYQTLSIHWKGKRPGVRKITKYAGDTDKWGHSLFMVLLLFCLLSVALCLNVCSWVPYLSISPHLDFHSNNKVVLVNTLKTTIKTKCCKQ